MENYKTNIGVLLFLSFSKEHTNDGLTIQKGAKQTGIMMVFVLFFGGF